jgi:hypothetical protein
MHVTSRMMKVTGGRMAEAISMTSYTLGLLNTNLGAQFGASIMVGGDPTIINSTGFWESMAQYETFRATIAQDAEIGTALRIGANLFSDDVEDTMWQVHSAPGEGEQYAIITSARINLARVGEAIAFAAQAAEAVSGVTGRPVGMATAITGDVTRLLWIGYAPDLVTLEDRRQALQASDDYAAIFANADGLIEAGSFESNIWQNLST